MRSKRCRPLILVTLAGGGYGRECKVIIQGLACKADFVYTRLRSCGGMKPGKGGVPYGPEIVLPDLQTISSGSWLTSMGNGMLIFFKMLRFLQHHRPDCVAGVTARESVFILAAARLLGIQTVFIESITRVTVPSLTLKLIAWLRLSRHVWVQWPELASKVPNADYRGSVL
jgi:oligosaccharide biosynthesis protein Alg14